MAETWYENFIREAGIRKSVIIYGNIDDMVYNKEKGVYDSVLNTVIGGLNKLGISRIVKWDHVNGIDKKCSKNYEGLMSGCDSGKEKANAYVLDEDLTDTQPANELQSPEDFFQIVYERFGNNRGERCAYIIDWSHNIFGSGGALLEQERKWLTLLGKALNESKNGLTGEELNKPSDIIVLISRQLGSIPPVYYQNNPSVKQICLPIPSRKERENFVLENINKFKFKKTLSKDNPEINDFIDALDGLTLTDIFQLIKLSRQSEEQLSWEKTINLYKYGEKTSPWEELSREKIQNIEKILSERVKGQDDAIRKVKEVIIRAFTGFAGLQHSAKNKKPKGTLFFVGPTGVGKTELAKSLAQFLFGDESACIRFDMSEFNHEHSDQRLIGAPPGYVGYEEGGQLTNAVKAKPFCVLLFDEIEKAHPRILDKFLQILEDGRLTDGKGETVYFSEAVIIFTSNIGASNITGLTGDKSQTRSHFRKEVETHFVNVLKRPELLNRIGNNVVVFDMINNATFKKEIAKSKLKPVFEFVKEKYGCSIYFENEEEALEILIKNTPDSQGGRGVINAIETKLFDNLSEFIFINHDKISTARKIKIYKDPMIPVLMCELI